MRDAKFSIYSSDRLGRYVSRLMQSLCSKPVNEWNQLLDDETLRHLSCLFDSQDALLNSSVVKLVSRSIKLNRFTVGAEVLETSIDVQNVKVTSVPYFCRELMVERSH